MKIWYFILLYFLLSQSVTIPVLADNTITLKIKPENLSYTWGQSGFNISWMAESGSDGTFIIRELVLLNNHTINWVRGAGTWESNELVSIPFDDLNVGTHEMNLTLENDYNTLNYGFTINIAETSEVIPTEIGTDIIFMEVPNNFTYQIYTLGHNIQWIAYAADPTSYSIHDEEVTFQNGEWESLEPIITNVDGYGIGEHEVTLVLYNSNSSTIRHKVPFKVISKVIPVVTPLNEELMFDESIIAILSVSMIMIILFLIIKKYKWFSTEDFKQNNGTN